MNLGSPYPTGQGNIDDDPQFVDGSSANYRLECGSPAINAGDDDYVEGDAFDLWQNGDGTVDDNPDSDRLWRIAGTDGDGTDVDMGAYETQPPPCAADVNDDGTVDVNDMLAVMNAWGSCSSCAADFWPGPCAGEGDGVVDDHELALVVLFWGSDCGESFGGGGSGDDLLIVQQCILEALEENLTGEAFVDYLLDCLCEHGVIECD